MMKTSYEVELEGGARAEIRLRNDCPRECVEANARFWERAGKPAKVVLEYDGKRLFVRKA
jgi:hypothetical protein